MARVSLFSTPPTQCFHYDGSQMFTLRNPILLAGLALLAAFALASLLVSQPLARTAIGDLLPLFIVGATVFLAIRNALDSPGHTRLFWWLIASGMALWWVNYFGWAWVELLVRASVPTAFFGDVVLFLHLVPIMAAVAIRPHEADEREGTLSSTVSVLILLTWWIVVYAAIVFPDEFIVTNIAVYSRNYAILFVMEQVVLIALSARAFLNSTGTWRTLYGFILVSSTLYAVAADTIRIAALRHHYSSGGFYDIPLLASALGFLGAAYFGRTQLHETQAPASAPTVPGKVAPILAKLALLSFPVMGYWALFFSQSPALVRQVRFGATMIGIVPLAFLIFFKQQLLDRKLEDLLEHSQSSYDNLERLQGRVVQQEKLASLGELVALAATELDYPLSSILENSEQLSTSGDLRLEQLSIARKIGQQARRTRELVHDLMSFAQQAPGEKSPVELKPLIQRAVQMEGFKLENRKITLKVEGEDPLPRVLANANQLMQAFLQIIENAVDSLLEVGGGRLVITLTRDSSEIVVMFADTGSGLRNPERVFDPFYTTKPVGKGTGLGLSATYGVIRDHQGQITCYNQTSGGAVFEIRLPILKTESVPMESATRA